VAVLVFAVLPHMGAPTELSAAEILGRSLNTLTRATGIERLEYQLTIGGLGEGDHRVEHLIDHAASARYRLASYGPDGLLRSAVAQDPGTGRRSQLVRLDGRNFIVHVQAGDTMPSMPEMAQAQIEAVIGMMQATADQKLTVLETPQGRQYVIEMPPAAPAGSGVAFDLQQARAVVDGRDFRIREFDAAGLVLKQPYTISFRLLNQERLAADAVTSADFAIEASPGDVVLEGEPSDAPIASVVHAALREVGRLRPDR
jgi:hypothetical protein